MCGNATGTRRKEGDITETIFLPDDQTAVGAGAYATHMPRQHGLVVLPDHKDRGANPSSGVWSISLYCSG